MKRQRLSSLLWILPLLVSGAPGHSEEPAAASSAPAVIVEGSGNVVVGGQPAARTGDAADNAQPIAQGSTNVFINGRPAVTVGDATACGGIIVGGASNVFINGKPMARSGDLATGCPQK